jgi:hypothetical protein
MDEGLIRTGFKAVWEKSRPNHLVFPLKNPPRATRHAGRKHLMRLFWLATSGLRQDLIELRPLPYKILPDHIPFIYPRK